MDFPLQAWTLFCDQLGHHYPRFFPSISRSDCPVYCRPGWVTLVFLMKKIAFKFLIALLLLTTRLVSHAEGVLLKSEPKNNAVVASFDGTVKLWLAATSVNVRRLW